MTSSLSSHGEQKLTPQPLLDMNYAFARTALLVAAVRLHLFPHLSKKALTPAELAACADVVPEPAERLLQGLASLGLAEREGEAYRLTPMADLFLVEGKPSYLGMAYHTTLAQYSVERDCVTVDLVPNAMHLDRIQRAASGHVTVKEGAV